MFKELIDSLKGNINNKIRNPFLGTMTFVYIIKNWELFYIIFTLDTSIEITKRIEIIRPVFSRSIGFINLVLVLAITIIVFLSSYFLLTFSRLVVQFVNKKINPRVDKITDDKSIVSIQVYNKLLKDYNDLQDKSEKDHIAVNSLRSERDTLQDRILELTKKSNETIVYRKKNTNTSDKNVIFNQFLMKISNNNWDNMFDEIIKNIRSNMRINTNDIILGELLKYSMVERNEKYSQSRESNVYVFTDVGNEFIQYYVLQKQV